MKLLELDGMVGIPSPELTQIKEFHELIKRDRTHGKRKASAELAYIYYLLDWESPYAVYEEGIRSDKIIRDIFEEEWEPDEVVKGAINKYVELTESEFKKMLQAARIGANKLISYFTEVDLSDEDEKGKLKHSAKDLIANISKMGEVMEGIEKLIELVEKNEEKQNANRKGIITTKFNE